MRETDPQQGGAPRTNSIISDWTHWQEYRDLALQLELRMREAQRELAASRSAALEEAAQVCEQHESDYFLNGKDALRFIAEYFRALASSPAPQRDVVEVPREPTSEMLKAGCCDSMDGPLVAEFETRQIYRAMLAAAPTSERSGK